MELCGVSRHICIYIYTTKCNESLLWSSRKQCNINHQSSLRNAYLMHLFDNTALMSHSIRAYEFTDLSSCNPWSAWTARNLQTSSNRQKQHVVTTLLFESEVWGSHGSNLRICDTMYSGRSVPYRTHCLCLLFQIHTDSYYKWVHAHYKQNIKDNSFSCKMTFEEVFIV